MSTSVCVGVMSQCIYVINFFASFQSCTAVQNILVDRHCKCEDIFLCPHEGDSGYSVLISDFDSALHVDRGRERLERSKHCCRPIKYSLHGTAGFRPPEVGEEMYTYN